jgi:hypothetical protein
MISHNEYMKIWRRNNSERWKAIHNKANKKYRLNHLEKIKECARKYLKQHCENSKKWQKDNLMKVKAVRLINNCQRYHPEKYPLDNKCEFCGDTEKLEHGHIDYDYPELYLTVCHSCNYYMGRSIVVEE